MMTVIMTRVTISLVAVFLLQNFCILFQQIYSDLDSVLHLNTSAYGDVFVNSVELIALLSVQEEINHQQESTNEQQQSTNAQQQEMIEVQALLLQLSSTNQQLLATTQELKYSLWITTAKADSSSKQVPSGGGK